MGSSMRKSLLSNKYGFRYDQKGCCIVCGEIGPVVYWEDAIDRHSFALCSYCCQIIMAIHEGEDL